MGSSRRTAWVPGGPLEASWGEANPAADVRRDAAMPRLTTPRVENGRHHVEGAAIGQIAAIGLDAEQVGDVRCVDVAR